MNRLQLEKQFTPAERIIIKRFLTMVNDATTQSTDFAASSDVDTLNQFSELAETDEQISQNVKEWLRLKKVRLRGNQTNN